MIAHLACIMDGNRRFAQRYGWKPWLGHKEGLKAVERVIDFCLEYTIPFLSLYAFSAENFKRPAEEISYLWDVLFTGITTFEQKACDRDIAVRFIGDRALFPSHLVSPITEFERTTQSGKKLIVNVLFCYGSRQEIVAGVKKIAHEVRIGHLLESDISESLFMEHLWTGQVPPPDLIVRTGGHRRLSNFLLYQAAYSELYFLDCLWPEITHDDLVQAVSCFSTRERNFGT